MSAFFMRRQKKRICFFCKDKVDYVDYKDLDMLRSYVSDKGKIKPKRVTGTCPRHQKRLERAVKNAREMALIPYTMRQASSNGR